MARTRVLQSAAIIVNVNGKPFGVCTNFQWQSATPKKALYGLDQIDPFELGVTTTKITGTVGVYRTDGDGGAEGWGLGATYEDLSREKYFSLLLVDRASDRVIFQADYCSLVVQSWNIPAKGVVTGQFQFEALKWNNEIRPLTTAT